MVFRLGILTTILLASGVLAVPSSSSRLEARLVRRRENRQSQPINITQGPGGAVTNTYYSDNWAGATWSKKAGTFSTVSGVFTVPTPTGSDGSASAWVGIDGNSRGDTLLQTGIDFSIDGGVVSYDAWYEWFPDVAHDYGGFSISAGDQISVSVSASSYFANSGTAVIENLSTGQLLIQELASSYTLCRQDAEWIVEDFDVNGIPVHFANFDTITFTSAIATANDGKSYTPDGATISNIRQQNDVLTSVSVSGDSFTVTYV